MFSKTLYLSALILGTVTSFASAGYTVTSPASGAVLNGGDSAKVLWTGADGPTIDVNLMKGSASNLQMVKQLCKGIDPKVGECDFTVDSSWTSERDYAIQLGTPSDYGYSSYFTIQANGALPVSSGCPNMGGQNCPQSLPCCSSSGYCGSSDAYCGTGCVAKYSFNGQCVVPGAVTSAAASATTAAAQATSAAAQAPSSVTSAAAQATSAAAQAPSSVTSSAANAASSVTSSAANTGAQAPGSAGNAVGQASNGVVPITNPVSGSTPDSDDLDDSDYNGHGAQNPFNLPDSADPDFGKDLNGKIHKDIKDQFKKATNEFSQFGKNFSPKRRRGLNLRRRQA